MLELKNVCVEIDNLPVVTNVCMKVNDGEMVSLLGANGAGKSSLVRAISGLNSNKTGSIVFDGEEIIACTPAQIVEAGIIQVPEGRKLFGRMSVKENLEIGAFAKRARKDMAKNLEFVYSIFPELVSMASKAVGDLSGGQQQMVAIGRGIMACPKLLILDEPSIGLSPIMTQKVFEAVNLVKQNGVSVLITEQNVKAVLKMADTAYVMQQGEIVLSGKASEMMDNEDVKKAYIGM